MAFFSTFDYLPQSSLLSPKVLALGNFDGIHLGHQNLLMRANAEAQKLGGISFVLSFFPHPLEVLRPPHEKVLSLEDQIQEIKNLGLGGIVHLNFTKDLSQLSPVDFLEKIIATHFSPEVIVVGFNFKFGFQRQGGLDLLKSWGQKKNIKIHIVDPIQLDGEPLSTSRIRSALDKGDMDFVNRGLNRIYSFESEVVEGAQRGRDLGFPTANFKWPGIKVPKDGVYATQAIIRNNGFPSVTHIGPKPSFNEADKIIETHIIGFNQNLYGKKIRILFYQKIRDPIKFNLIDDLKKQIAKDIETALYIRKI